MLPPDEAAELARGSKLATSDTLSLRRLSLAFMSPHITTPVISYVSALPNSHRHYS